MKGHTFALLTITLLTSCIGTKRFTSFVEPKFEETKTNSNNNSFVFNFPDLDTTNRPVVSTKLKSLFIPAILFWQWNNTIKCEIDPMIVRQSFQEDFLNIANSLNLEDRLQGRTLEISLESMPNSFVYTHKGTIVIFIIAYTVSELKAIFPQEQKLVVNFKLTQNGELIKKGKLTIDNKDLPLRNLGKSTKKFTLLYVEQFKKNSENMTKEIVEKLLQEI